MAHEVPSGDLIIRDVYSSEVRQYGLINDFTSHESNWQEEYENWYYEGALQLFIIHPGAASQPELDVQGGTVIGFIKIKQLDGGGGEISFCTHPSAQRRGYMKGALKDVFNYWFENLGMQYIFLETRQDNTAVITMMSNWGLNGYAREGSLSGYPSWAYTFYRPAWGYRS
jgi:RimJ/RimL family protein N-acetyltransferase